MAYSRVTNKYGAMTNYQLKELLSTMVAGLDPVKPTATFSRTPGQASIEKSMDY